MLVVQKHNYSRFVKPFSQLSTAIGILMTKNSKTKTEDQRPCKNLKVINAIFLKILNDI